MEVCSDCGGRIEVTVLSVPITPLIYRYKCLFCGLVLEEKERPNISIKDMSKAKRTSNAKHLKGTNLDIEINK